MAHNNPAEGILFSPDDPEALAKRAQDLAVPMLENPALKEDVEQLARRALVSDAAEYRAYRTLAWVAQREDRDEDADLLMRQTLAISKRDLGARLYTVRQSGEAGEIRQFVEELRLALRTSGTSRAMLLPLLAESLSDPASAELVADLLAKDPEWASTFWRVLPQVPEAWPGVASLLGAAEQRDVTVFQGPVLTLINRLVAEERIPLAVEIGTALQQVKREDPDAPIAPFEWAYQTDGTKAVFPGSNGEFTIDAVPGTGGPVARRLVMIPDGAARVAASYSLERATTSSAPLPYLSLTCMEPMRQIGDLEPADSDDRELRAQAEFDLGGECEYALARILVPSIEPGETLVARVSGLDVQPVMD
ncbi:MULTISPECIES: hypothetical protein [Pacificimonas]|uniref:HEAT repeat domain-containing protein n=1 Tax=Pacificimonas aurantium TaxID=1250540 RepID=A0ABS7WHJ9_9SPHN|nr:MULTISPECIES: hypothetical protein [Pacificimonas]MBZ6377440.1 hypothetical protein [Pacificimonas aurantium]